MKRKKVLSVLGKIFAGWFATLLTIVLIVTPIASSVQRLVVPDKLSDVLGEIDFAQMLLENEDLNKQLEEAGLSAEAVNALLHSEVVGDVIDLYAQDVGSVLDGAEAELAFTADGIMNVLNENMDEVVALTRQFMPNADAFSDQEIKKQFQQNMQEQSQAIVEMLPPISDLKQTFQGDATSIEYGNMTKVKEGISFVQSSLMPILYATICLLVVLILAMRFRAMRGVWKVGITFVSAAITSFVLATAIGNLTALGKDVIPEELTGFLSPMTQVLSKGIMPFAITYAVIAVVCIVSCLVVKSVHKKQEAALAAEGEAVVETATDVLEDIAEEQPTELLTDTVDEIPMEVE